jgi:hypothetical protein
MADLKDAAEGGREFEDVVGFSERGGEGFFDEDIVTGTEKLLRDGGMMNGRDTDGCGVESEAGGEEIVDGGESGNVVESGGLLA